MTNVIYLSRGESLLPGDYSLETLILNNEPLSSRPIEYASEFNKACFGAFLEDVDLKALGADRMVRKTSEKQSRWLIAAGVRTWRAYSDKFEALQKSENNTELAQQKQHANTGLFLGLGSVDSDDNIEPHYLAEGTTQCLSDTMCQESKPLIGLVMLNSSATSHIAQLTGITGVNCCFAPHVDAGASALFEAVTHVQEGEADRALCGSGSQKLSPWYFLAYEDYLNQQDNICLTEAASFLVLERENNDADAVLHTMHRGQLGQQNQRLTPFIAKALNEVESIADSQLVQILCVGLGDYQTAVQQVMNNLAPPAPTVFVEDWFGYAGAAGVPLTLNLAISLLEHQKVIRHESNDIPPSDASALMLVLVFGPAGKASYFIVGESDKEVKNV